MQINCKMRLQQSIRCMQSHYFFYIYINKTEFVSVSQDFQNECRCSLVFFAAAPSPPPPTQAARNLPETTGPGQSQLPTGRPPLIGREVQATAGVSCDMMSHMRTTHGTYCHVDLQLLTELRSQHAYLYSQARFRWPITRLPQRASVEIFDIGVNNWIC